MNWVAMGLRIKQPECMHLADPAWGRMWWMLFFYGAKPSNFGLPIIIILLSWFHSQSYSAKLADLCRWYGLFVECYLRTNHCRWNDASSWCLMIITITKVKYHCWCLMIIIVTIKVRYHYCNIYIYTFIYLFIFIYSFIYYHASAHIIHNIAVTNGIFLVATRDSKLLAVLARHQQTATAWSYSPISNPKIGEEIVVISCYIMLYQYWFKSILMFFWNI